MRNAITITALILATGFAFVISGCGTSAPAKPAVTNSEKPATTPLAADFFLKEPPAGAKDVLVVKKEAKEGDEVLIRGRVGGGKNDTFTQGRAMMYIMDPAIHSCDMNPGDDCATPWDYCCETPEDIAANKATIQFVGPDDKVLKADLKGSNGIDHLSVVVVKGKVGKRDDPKVLVVNASGIYVEKPAPALAK